MALVRAGSAFADIPKPRRRAWLLMVQVVCTLALVGWIVRQVDFQPLAAQFARIRWATVALLFGLGVVDRLLTAWKWHVLLVAKNIRLRLGEAFRMQMIATFFGSFLPTAVGMDAVRIYLVARATRRTLDSVSASTVDRLLTVVGTFLIAGAAILVTAVREPDGTRSWPIALVMFLIAVGALVAAQARWMARLKPIARRVLGHRMAALCSKFYWNLNEFRSRRDAVAACCAITAGSFVVRIVCVKVAAAALAIDVSFGALLLSLPLTWVALMLPFSIGGLGLQETAYLIALGSVDIAPASAVAISLLDQMTMRAVSLLGAVFWLIGRRSDVQASLEVPA
jgi:uncharacterized protein (TIRG00374 family)